MTTATTITSLLASIVAERQNNSHEAHAELAQARIVDVIAALMPFVAKRMYQAPPERTIESLCSMGYTVSEVSAAVSWCNENLDNVHSKTAKLRYIADVNPASFRMLHTFEEACITPEVFSYVSRLHDLGILSRDDFERVLDSYMLSGMQPIDMQTARRIVARVVFAEPSFQAPVHKFYLDGSQQIQ
jgi:uncharacterized protein Smg (DUF494 family)